MREKRLRTTDVGTNRRPCSLHTPVWSGRRALILGIILFLFTIPSITLASTWEKQTVDSVGDVGRYPSIALDSNNYPHIGYYDWTNYDLKYAKWRHGTLLNKYN